MALPEEASVELERAVKELGFCGAMIDDHLEDMTHYNGEKFWIVFETAERLDVPIYTHPSPCSEETLHSRLARNYSHGVAFGLSRGGWGWHETVALHILKLWGAGLFDRFPKLKIIIGHMGELLPIWIDRISDATFSRKAGLRSFDEIWNSNIWVTSSGMFSVRTLEIVLKTTRIERFLYSVDPPFNKNAVGLDFLQEIAKSGVLSAEELDMFAFGNAKKLLMLNVSHC